MRVTTNAFRLCVASGFLACVFMVPFSHAQARNHQTEPSLEDTLQWLTGASEQESGDGDEHIEFTSKRCHAVISEYRVESDAGFCDSY